MSGATALVRCDLRLANGMMAKAISSDLLSNKVLIPLHSPFRETGGCGVMAHYGNYDRTSRSEASEQLPQEPAGTSDIVDH